MTALPGSVPTDPGVELVERALSYTRGALASVTPGHLDLPTPCDRWRLGDLLAHMEDALDAFAEGASGRIGLRSAAPAPLEDRLAALQRKACSLLGAWASATAPVVSVAGHDVLVGTVTRLAAVEIAVHGWDVARTTGHDEPLPDALAAQLLPTATALALEADAEFARPVPVAADAGGAVRLLAVLGRRA